MISTISRITARFRLLATRPKPLLAVFALSLGVSVLMPAAAQQGKFENRRANPSKEARERAKAEQVKDRYIVVFKKKEDKAKQSRDGRVSDKAARLASKHRGKIHKTYEGAVDGFSATLPAEEVEALRRDSEVAYVGPNQHFELHHDFRSAMSWGLDRINQRERPLDGMYGARTFPSDVYRTVFVIDTGIEPDHVEFDGRARIGYDATRPVGSWGYGVDCYGHGTHVAGTIAGQNYGVARNARIVGVKVMDCDYEMITTEYLLSAIDWVMKNRVPHSIVNMSLGGPADPAVDMAVSGMTNNGITVVVSAGNSNADACNVSPAREQSAITVGAMGPDDDRWYVNASLGSNWGGCIDIWAPGRNITSSYYGWGDMTTLATMSGTSMAAPHVAGAVALMMEETGIPSPAAAQMRIINESSSVTGPSGRSSRYLYTGYLGYHFEYEVTPSGLAKSPAYWYARDKEIAGRINEGRVLTRVWIGINNQRSFTYQVYVNGTGWLPVVGQRTYTGNGQQIEQIRIMDSPHFPNAYQVCYEAYVRGQGWKQGCNGAPVGTVGVPIEAIRIWSTTG